jgi:hypothetical protein
MNGDGGAMVSGSRTLLVPAARQNETIGFPSAVLRGGGESLAALKNVCVGSS